MINIIEQLKKNYDHEINLAKTYQVDVERCEAQIAKSKEQIAFALQRAEELKKAIAKLEAP